jgi:hypothetical protein
MWWLNLAEGPDNPAKPSHPTPKPKDDPKAKPAVVSEDQILEDDDDQASVGDEINVMLNALLPWTISLILHLGVFLLAVFVFWSQAVGVQEERHSDLVAKMYQDNPSELLIETEDLDVPATTPIPRETETQEVAKGNPLSPLSVETDQSFPTIGVTGTKALPAGSPFGKDPLGVGMYGVGGNARLVVYVVDASGSLIDALPFVIEELKDSFRRLSDQQKFNVIFFQEDTYIEVPVPNRGLKVATEQNIAKVNDWISLEAGNVIPRGSSNPTKAIDRAIKQRPDLIYILSDNITGKGRFAVDQAELLEMIEKTKQRYAPELKINTIQFLYPDPLLTLKMIATKHNGRYRFVDESVVGLK